MQPSLNKMKITNPLFKLGLIGVATLTAIGACRFENTWKIKKPNYESAQTSIELKSADIPKAPNYIPSSDKDNIVITPESERNLPTTSIENLVITNSMFPTNGAYVFSPLPPPETKPVSFFEGNEKARADYLDRSYKLVNRLNTALGIVPQEISTNNSVYGCYLRKSIGFHASIIPEYANYRYEIGVAEKGTNITWTTIIDRHSRLIDMSQRFRNAEGLSTNMIDLSRLPNHLSPESAKELVQSELSVLYANPQRIEIDVKPLTLFSSTISYNVAATDNGVEIFSFQILGYNPGGVVSERINSNLSPLPP